MMGPLTSVREIPNVGFEVVRLSPLGRRAIGFRLKAEDANELALGSYEWDRTFLLLNPKGPQPRLELWEAPDEAA